MQNIQGLRLGESYLASTCYKRLKGFIMKKMKSLLSLSLLVCSISSYADIFGSDDRVDIILAGKARKLGRSVAVGVINSLWLDTQENFSELWVDSLSDFMCRDERFSRQKNISYACTGFLVGEDLLVTAGHCAVNVGEVRNQSENYCDAYTWLFDYTGQTNARRIRNDNIYKCKEIIYAVQEEIEGRTHDFALIRLDRKVKGRKALKISDELVKENDSVSMIGHPMGMPMKYTDNAHVFDNEVGRSYYTNLDAFAGNSGSPVFNKSNEVIGVLVAGNPAMSTYRDDRLGCDRYNHCDEEGKNCTSLTFENEDQGFPNVYSEVQSIEFYKNLIEENL